MTSGSSEAPARNRGCGARRKKSRDSRAACPKILEKKVKTMKKASLRYSSTCFALLMAGTLAVTAFGATRNLATVTFPQPIAVGSATLPAGQYTISDVGGDAFVVQSVNGDENAMILGRRVETDTEAPKTSVTLSDNAGALHINKLVIGGQAAEYDFEGR
jgi:hypothetical protein